MGNEASRSAIGNRKSYKSSSRYQLYEPVIKPIGLSFDIKTNIDFTEKYALWILLIRIRNVPDKESRQLLAITDTSQRHYISKDVPLIEKEWLEDSKLEFCLGTEDANGKVKSEIRSLEMYIGTKKVSYEDTTLSGFCFTVEITTKEPKDVQYAINSGLCSEESLFVECRKKIIYDKMVEKLDPTMKMAEVPNIAIIGSGGGLRATIGMSGAMTALEKCDILDYAMYTAGVSGSAWYLMTLYAYNEQVQPSEVNDIIRENLNKSKKSLLDMAFEIANSYRNPKSIPKTKYFTLANAFGEVIGRILFDGNRSSELKWSDQKTKLTNGSVPLPLLTVLQVRHEKKIKEHNEWIELSPYQVYLPSYGAAINMEKFGDEFVGGGSLNIFEELSIQFLLGMCGSAYALVREYRPRGNRVVMSYSLLRNKIWLWFGKFDNSCVATVPNFLHGEMMFLKLPDHPETIQDSSVSTDNGDTEINEKKKKPAKDSTDTIQDSCVSTDKGDTEIKEKENNPVKDSTDIDQKHLSVPESNTNEQTLRYDNNTAGASKGRVWFGRLRNLGYWYWTVNKDGVGSLINTLLSIAGFGPFFLAKDEEHIIAAEKLVLVDAGLAFNSPYPTILRPSREVDVILSFDFSDRKKDTNWPFKVLQDAEKWANKRRVPFPNITEKLDEIKHSKEPYEEVYVFKGDDAPTIVHFVMVNKSFRKIKQGLNFCTCRDFDILPDYSTLKFAYTTTEFNRFNQLVQHNVESNRLKIVEAIKGAITNKKKKQEARD